MTTVVTTKILQAALVAAGFDPGPVDGVTGPRTRAALRAFQAAQGLMADGMAGPQTRALLGTTPPWFDHALGLLGIRERAGTGDNPVILAWAKALGLAYAGDSVPWCGLFAAHCLASTLPGDALPTQPLRARAWAPYGQPIAPVPGAIMVFWRGSRSGAAGHVGFHAGQDDRAFRILGGNQSDGVTLTWLARDRLLAARWPLAVTLPAARSAVVSAARSGPLSVNEA